MPRYLGSATRKQLIARQRLILDRTIIGAQRLIKPQLDQASRRMLLTYARTGVVPDNLEEDAQAIREVLEKITMRSIVASGQEIITQKSAAFSDWETEDFAETFLRFSAEYISQEVIRKKISSIAKTTRENIVNAIARSVTQEGGTSYIAIAREISRTVPSINRARAELIASTEAHGAATYGSDQAAVATGLSLSKEWGTTEDRRAREDHIAADGQVRQMEEAFLVGGVRMMRPGDPNAPVEQIARCRCLSLKMVND